MQLHDLFPSFVEDLVRGEDLSPNTIRAYVADARALAQFLGPGASVTQLDPTVLEGFVGHLLASGLKRSSARRRYRHTTPPGC